MNIIQIYPENAGKRQRYDLTCRPVNQRLSTCEGQVLDVAAWCLYEDEDRKNGEIRRLLSIETPEGEVYTSNSSTVISEFLKLVDMFGADGVEAVEIISGMSKNGRKYYTVAYAGE